MRVITPLRSALASVLFGVCATALADVDVNQASLADLEAVKGIGPAIAERIIEERWKSSFRNWRDLIDRVRGIGPDSAARYSDEGLTVNGWRYTPGPATTPRSRGGASAPATKP